MGASTKRAKPTRRQGEFDLVRLSADILHPYQSSAAWTWDLDLIRAARTEQLSGRFRAPAFLAKSMKTDPAIYTALLNRLAPPRGLPVALLQPKKNGRAARIANEADALFGQQGIAISPATLGDIHEQLVQHGVAFARNVWTTRDDGSRVDVEIKPWPIEFVDWLPQTRSFRTILRTGQIVEINHGDGRWIVIKEHDLEPWTWGAVGPAAILWADRAFGVRDRSMTSKSHASAKMLGSLPDGVALQDATGNITSEAQNMLDMLRDMHDSLPVGLVPAGASVDMKVNTSTAWQIFDSIIKGADTDASRIYLGSDGTTKDGGGNYIKSLYLFGVRNDVVEGDLRAISRGIQTGTIDPWSAINFGSSEVAPVREWSMPDADEDARRASIGERRAMFARDVLAYRQSGLEVSQPMIDDLTKDYGLPAIVIAATLPPLPPPGVKVDGRTDGSPQAQGTAPNPNVTVKPAQPPAGSPATLTAVPR